MIFRKPYYCSDCGEAYEENHRTESEYVGDTFISYKPHKCKSILEVFRNMKPEQIYSDDDSFLEIERSRFWKLNERNEVNEKRWSDFEKHYHSMKD